MAGTGAERRELMEALLECIEQPVEARPGDELEVGRGPRTELGDRLSAWVGTDDHGVLVVTLHSAVPPSFTNVNAANAGVIGAARWIVVDESLAVRVDLPPDATDDLVRHHLSHALELAGWPAEPVPPSRRTARVAEGRRRLHRTFGQLEIDPDRLRRLHGGLVVGHRSRWDLEFPHGVSDRLVDSPGLPLSYCVLHLVEDHRGVV